MNLERVFRGLVISDIALAITSIPAILLSERFLPPALQAYVHAESEAPLTVLEMVSFALAVAMTVVLVVAWVGLLRWRRSAPRLYLVACASYAPFLLIAGPTVLTAFETAIETAGSVVSGVILGMAYFSDLRARFRGAAQTTAGVEGA
jgi:choline-glycine betaine transporter